MKVPNVECARSVRNCCIDAMDALDEALREVEEHLSGEESQGLRLAIGRSMDVILTEMVNPVLRDFPELEEDEERWGDIAIEQARRRVAETTKRSLSPRG
jgi:hypothetical protein